MPPIPLPATRLSDEQLTELVDNPRFVLSIYGVVLIPLALYVYHDIVDKRWRQTSVIFRWLVLYLCLYVITALALITYITIQWKYGMDYKEVGAGVLTLIVGFHRLWTLIRLIRILQGHAGLVEVLQICSNALSYLAHGDGKPIKFKYRLIRKSDKESEKYLAISASLFDDDYPGESARISWLKRRVRVHPDDINECAARVAIWMRAVIRSTDVRIWDMITPPQSLESQSQLRTLHNTLLRVVLEKATPIAPVGLCKNPAEKLLNHPKEDQLLKIGIGVVWGAARMRAEEIAQIVPEMPASWMNDTLLSGKELMFEAGVCLMLAGMRPSEEGILRFTKNVDVEYEEFWRIVGPLFANAVAGMLSLDWANQSDEDDKRKAVMDSEYEKLMVELGGFLVCEQFWN